VAARRSLSSNTLLRAQSGAQGYFTVLVVIDKDHYLTYDGKSWDFNKDDRLDSNDFEDYTEYTKAREKHKAVIDHWSLVPELPRTILDLPVISEGRGEDVVEFKADGWGIDKILPYRQYRDEVVRCPSCWKLVEAWPRKNYYTDRPHSESTDADVLEFYGFQAMSLRVFYDANGRRDTRMEHCSNPLCVRAKDSSKEPAEFDLWIWPTEESGELDGTRGDGWHRKVNARALTARKAIHIAVRGLGYKAERAKWPVSRIRVVCIKDDTTAFEWELDDEGKGKILFPSREDLRARHLI